MIYILEVNIAFIAFAWISQFSNILLMLLGVL